MKDELSLKNLKIDIDRLLKLGFKRKNNYYIHEKMILDNSFNLIIKIYDDNVIKSDVIDTATGYKFTPYYIKDLNGNFVGTIKDEYDNIITKIKESCSYKNIFKSRNANLIINYVKEKYEDELEFLWQKFPNNAIFRNKDNNKWYAALLTVKKSKLGINEEGETEIIDLLLESEKIEKMVDNKQYYPGYHMNKKHWITVDLNGFVSIEKIYELIDNSYQLSKNKSKRKR